MNSGQALFLFILGSLLLTNCRETPKTNAKSETIEVAYDSLHLISDIEPYLSNGDVNAIIEIPAGTQEKWEVNKATGRLYLEQIQGEDRIVAYLGYPGNYGMIPKTKRSRSKGGDGDPLDIIVIGPPAKRGLPLPSKIIGVLFLEDGGEQDDKLIAVSKDSPLYPVNDLNELEQDYNGITEILQLWFTNYKGPEVMISKGYGDREVALEILANAILEYQSDPEFP